ncbi:uncharacterized protein LOC134092931 isoform X2 [Sardina pilchardus]|uniref:uncharacterized protein LOC134092931 isoform X2 n=1 Tax=Sardina pilchardus TaxID=27697 RepID=UPI002E107C5E
METDNVLKRQWLRTESYDQKLEHRATKHECLRDRNNVTSCRSPGTPQESDWKRNMRSKRQREFQKRRQISSEAALAAGGKDTTQEKVTLRGNRRKVPLIHRQSLVSSQDLGIIWPHISASAETSWMSSTGAEQEHDTGMMSGVFDLTSSTGFLEGGTPLRSVWTSEGAQNNRGSNHISRSDFSCQTECGYVTIKEEDLFQLGEYLKEALWREETLKQKLALLQQETSTLLTYCDKMWRACFKEDLMKCKIGALESQLQVCAHRFSKDEGKRLLILMEEQFRLEEERTVASLQRITEEKTKALDRVISLERAVERAQEESNHWRHLHEEQGLLCAQLRASLQQSSDQILTLQSQMEKAALHEDLLQEQLQQLQEQYATSLEQDQHCVHKKDTNASTAPLSGHHSTTQAHHHKGRLNAMAVSELSATDHNCQPGVKAPQQGTTGHKRGMRGVGEALPDHGELCRAMHTGSDLTEVSQVL